MRRRRGGKCREKGVRGNDWKEGGVVSCLPEWTILTGFLRVLGEKKKTG